MARKRTYKGTGEILASEKYTSFTIQVDNTGVAADEYGKKIIKQGTIWPKNDATARGVILNDVDVTYESAMAALMVEGYVYKSNLPVAPTDAAIASLPKLTFVDDNRLPIPPAVHLVSIEITTDPTKTAYTVGDELDLTGMVVTATYTDGSTAALSVNELNCTGFDSSEAAASQTITVTYQGKTDTFTISITAA